MVLFSLSPLNRLFLFPPPATSLPEDDEVDVSTVNNEGGGGGGGGEMGVVEVSLPGLVIGLGFSGSLPLRTSFNLTLPRKNVPTLSGEVVDALR